MSGRRGGVSEVVAYWPGLDDVAKTFEPPSCPLNVTCGPGWLLMLGKLKSAPNGSLARPALATVTNESEDVASQTRMNVRGGTPWVPATNWRPSTLCALLI